MNTHCHGSRGVGEIFGLCKSCFVRKKKSVGAIITFDNFWRIDFIE